MIGISKTEGNYKKNSGKDTVCPPAGSVDRIMVVVGNSSGGVVPGSTVIGI
jgi:hypothetical protein